ncbi:MAG: hypothetical protein Q8Q62_07225 [Mesorhizobium sp.]|nr:hypothetical protein [Mesorhizobium sp.]
METVLRIEAAGRTDQVQHGDTAGEGLGAPRTCHGQPGRTPAIFARFALIHEPGPHAPGRSHSLFPSGP